MRFARVALAVALVITAVAAGAAPALTQTEPTAVVSLGDSYMSGEAGRWAGNSTKNFGDRSGTDRAARWSSWRWRYIEELVYGTSYSNGCRRSDVAPLPSADLAVDAIFNLACAGATTRNVLPAAAGGRSRNGEAPQLDQLAVIASTHDVEVVAISIGGNDLGFGDVVLDCVVSYVTSTRWNPNTCNERQHEATQSALPDAMDRVGRVLEEARRILDDNNDLDARIIVQSYPSPVAESDNVRYAQTGWRRTFTGGCPFWDADLDWANDVLVPALSDGLAKEAANAGVEFLNLTDALKGHEACAGTARQGTGTDGAGAEWIRFITTGITQGDVEESAHPNAYGQKAMGRCLALAVASDARPDRCTNVNGSGVTAMVLN